MTTRWQLLLLLVHSLLLLLSLAGVATADEEPQPPLSTQPFQQSLIVGSNATVTCHLSPELAANYSTAELSWYLPNGSLILDGSWDDWQRANVSSSNGTLTAIHLAEASSGEYVCSLPGRQYNASATLQVYAMPSYLSQLTVVYAVDGALLLVFVALGIQSLLTASRGGRATTVVAVVGQQSRQQQQQQQQQQHPLHHSRSQSRVDQRSRRGSNNQDRRLDEGDEAGVAIDDAESQVRHHRHHSTVPKLVSTEQ